MDHGPSNALIDFGPTGDYLAGLMEWVAIESPTADAAAVNRMMDRAATELEGVGARVERIAGRDGRGGHLVATAPWNEAGSPGILVLLHLDTVHPLGSLALNPIRTEGNRAYGPGIIDMKAGAYLALTALKRLVAAGRRTPLPVTLVVVSDEETGSMTSRDLIESLARQSRYALVMEPARVGGRVVTSRKGVGRFRLSVRGVPAHAGNAHADGRSAIRELATQILRLEEMTDYGRGITVNVGRVEGGTADNVVPELASAAIDLRVPTEVIAKEMTARILSLVPALSGTLVEVTGGMNRSPYRKSDRRDIGQLFDHAVGLAREIGFTLADLPNGEGAGGSDGQFCVDYVPVLDGLGPCGGGLHTHDEYIELDSVRPRGTLLLHLLQTLS